MSRDLARRAGSAVVWRSGSLAAEKLIFLARLVILARILVPEDFGLVAIGMSAMALVSESPIADTLSAASWHVESSSVLSLPFKPW